MVKVREPQQPSQPKKAALSEAEKAAKAESFGNEAIPTPPKEPRPKPFKAITYPFWAQEEYERLIKAAQKANMKHTSFMIKAVNDAIDKELGKH